MRAALLVCVVLGCAPVSSDDDADLDPDAAEAIVDAAPDAEVDAEIDSGPAGPTRFRFPVHVEDRALIDRAPLFGVDHDPADGNGVGCLDYDGRGFPWCYDGHDGSDFLLDGGFYTMDRGSARVVAAAPGEVIGAHDGEYDRCASDPRAGDVLCDGEPPGRANSVKIRHHDGWESWYWHLKQGSVAVTVGQHVECGEVLGLIGSSGRSSAPHIHFEVKTALGASRDPFAGSVSGPDSLWIEQDAGDGLPADLCP